MQYVFFIHSRAGCKKYVTRLRFVTYYFIGALERIKNTYCMGKRPFLYFLFKSVNLFLNWGLVKLFLKIKM